MGLAHLTVSVLIACALGGLAAVPDEPVPTTTVDDVEVAVGLDDRIARGRTDVTPPVPGPGSPPAGTAAAGSPAAPPSR